MGEWREPYIMCSTCRAMGEIVCPKCGGSGQDVHTDEQCSECNGNGTIVCPTCNGDTYIKNNW